VRCDIAGFAVDTAADDERGLAAAESNNYDVVVLDAFSGLVKAAISIRRFSSGPWNAAKDFSRPSSFHHVRSRQGVFRRAI
jgi:hypothetical protein